MPSGFIAYGVGNSAGEAAYSIDGKNWTPAYLSGYHDIYNNSSAYSLESYSTLYNSGLFIAAGDGAYTWNSIKYSYNGFNWYSGTLPYSTGVFTSYWFRDLLMFSGYYFMVNGSSNEVLRSSNGINWSISATGNLATIETNGSMLVAGCGSLGFAYSYNGTDWTNVPLIPAYGGFFDITWTGAKWISGNGYASGTFAIWYESNDGINWSGFTSSGTLIENYNNIQAFNNRVFIYGYHSTGNTMSYSDDHGRNWISLGRPAPNISRINNNGNTLVAVSNQFVGGLVRTPKNTIIYSTDNGLTWSGCGYSGLENPEGYENDIVYGYYDITSQPTLKIKQDYQVGYADIITPNVTLTRGDNKGIFNSVNEASYINNVSPENTEWATPDSDNYYVPMKTVSDPTLLTYTDWETAVDGNPYYISAKIYYMHDIISDRYFEFHFSTWSVNNTGGGMRYWWTEVGSSPAPISLFNPSTLRPIISNKRSTPYRAGTPDLINIGVKLLNSNRLYQSKNVPIEFLLDYPTEWTVFISGVVNNGVTSLYRSCDNITNIGNCRGYSRALINGTYYNSNIIRLNFNTTLSFDQNTIIEIPREIIVFDGEYFTF